METAELTAPRNLRPVRSGKNIVLTGLAGGLAARLGLDPTLVRGAFVVLSLAGGFGVILYVVLWLLSVSPRGGAIERQPLPGGRQVVAVACITFGTLIAVRELGLWFGDRLVWPLALAALGSSVIWLRSEVPRSGKPDTAADERVLSGGSFLRVAFGALLIFAGMGAMLAGGGRLAVGRVIDLAFPVAVTVAGVTLVFAPWLYRLAQQAGAERRERIRSEERSEMAAHLHDSVLQTLSLIQRADSRREMETLARVQERELRAWLYGKSRDARTQTLDAALDAMAGRVEQVHHAKVETVVVGNAPLDDRLRALVDACGEAVTNAAKHSRSSSVSVYAEVQQEAVTCYVRDHGVGFELTEVRDDRGGIRESIVGRVERHGGEVKIETGPGRGTEVHMKVPR